MKHVLNTQIFRDQRRIRIQCPRNIFIECRYPYALARAVFKPYHEARNEENSPINQQIREADEINKQLPPLTIPSTDILSYATHPQAIYTSRLLDFKNLPDPKNADNNDNSFETQYSGN